MSQTSHLEELAQKSGDGNWSYSNQVNAIEDGWLVIEEEDYGAVITLYDDDPQQRFATDSAVWGHLVSKAEEGSPLHCRALRHIQENNPDEFREMAQALDLNAASPVLA